MSTTQLELEIKEARASLANAELKVAKSQVKLEAARRAVIEQRLTMAKASLPDGGSACVEGGKILKRQLQFTVVAENNGNEYRNWRHLECVSDCQKKNVQRKHPSGEGLVGYETLKTQDKARVNEFFGWPQEEVDEWQSSSALPELSSAIGTPNVQAERISEEGPQESPTRPAWDESSLDDMSAIWGASGPNNELPVSDNQNQGQLLGLSDNGELRSLYDQLSSIAFVPRKVTVGAEETTSQEKGLRRESLANDERLLMQLELEEKEARARLANAELEVAKSHAKAEAARHAVIEQRLRMAKANVLRGDTVVPVM
ncbi:hypothetical protein M407DRAFT_31130 [Tulasnella calospora MUT 4182]|uniref:PARP-type domain-containing protein n=1 Tax=Tulasnella calospora MUT 4182 TaxID=1051891 RepID=A0A0C3PW68_9AGAM|nr:hypothetical protein M407DRAFT_31130 [Tulasnella calospora MUT 4182]